MSTSSTGSFGFFEDYRERVIALQPEYYREAGSILEAELRRFAEKSGRRPSVLDVGSAGVIAFDPELTESTTILDLFPQPPKLTLPPKVDWQVGNILERSAADDSRWDVVVMSSLLHHLADKRNHVTANVRTAFGETARRLRPGGSVIIIESFCPGVLSLAQDILYPLYSRLLVHVAKFTYVRMLSFDEVKDALEADGFSPEEIPFRQPAYYAQLRWRVPSRYYPLKVRCLKAVQAASSA